MLPRELDFRHPVRKGTDINTPPTYGHRCHRCPRTIGSGFVCRPCMRAFCSLDCLYRHRAEGKCLAGPAAPVPRPPAHG
jgi:hypothetical protein